MAYVPLESPPLSTDTGSPVDARLTGPIDNSIARLLVVVHVPYDLVLHSDQPDLDIRLQHLKLVCVDVMEVTVHETAQVGPVREILQDEVIHVNIDARMKGMKGSVFVVFICSKLDISAVLLVDFPYAVKELEEQDNGWKDKMVAIMNNGIVV
ncbi:hypothetical protein GYMLUDRAFT_241945 [Collybiopsis luxurians FD-317 M1]|uniref:Unplaced genomic scaffold GYMLUscaffold_16, whole genome shotgun sequence n=1 Tax=Collybiopsis luxurians FD-317 M1 TaxID=944289 RepID=A0A0D0BHN6_9AGAR|nr:hypothetical protein GYMLUDRAFT_241945 [Collybiopsis luxurians FD-317 M1]